MSCPDLVAEVGRVEAEINEADEVQTQAKQAMDAERQSRYGRKKSPLGELLSTTADILEGVKNMSGTRMRTPRSATTQLVSASVLRRIVEAI